MNNVLLKEIWINAPVEEVFKHFTQEDAMLSWHGKEVRLDPVPGGIYKVIFQNGDMILGEFKEVEENRRIIYHASYGKVHTVVEVTFIPANGGTTVMVRQEFKPGHDLSTFSHGWDYFLGILKRFWENGSDENCRVGTAHSTL